MLSGVLSGRCLAGKLVYGLELVALIALPVLEFISGYKGGLMKHLYFRKMEYMFGLYSKTNVLIHISGLMLVLLVLLLLVARRGWPAFGKRCLVRLSLYSLALVGAFFWPLAQEWVVYAYALMMIEAIIAVEVIKVTSFLISNRKRACCDTGYPLPN